MEYGILLVLHIAPAKNNSMEFMQSKNLKIVYLLTFSVMLSFLPLKVCFKENYYKYGLRFYFKVMTANCLDQHHSFNHINSNPNETNAVGKLLPGK